MSNLKIDTKEIWDCAKVINKINTPMSDADEITDVIKKLIVKYFPNLNLYVHKKDITNTNGRYEEDPSRYSIFFDVFTQKEEELIIKETVMYGPYYEIKSYDINNSYEFSIEHKTRVRVTEEANVEEIVHYGWLNSRKQEDGEGDFEDTYYSETTGSIASITGFLMQLIIGISLWEEEQYEKEDTK